MRSGSVHDMTRKPRPKRTAKKQAPPAVSSKIDRIEALAAASAQALALPVEAAWRSAIAQNLRLLFHHAALVDEFPLPDEIGPAPVFRA